MIFLSVTSINTALLSSLIVFLLLGFLMRAHIYLIGKLAIWTFDSHTFIHGKPYLPILVPF